MRCRTVDRRTSEDRGATTRGLGLGDKPEKRTSEYYLLKLLEAQITWPLQAAASRPAQTELLAKYILNITLALDLRRHSDVLEMN